VAHRRPRPVARPGSGMAGAPTGAGGGRRGPARARPAHRPHGRGPARPRGADVGRARSVVADGGGRPAGRSAHRVRRAPRGVGRPAPRSRGRRHPQPDRRGGGGLPSRGTHALDGGLRGEPRDHRRRGARAAAAVPRRSAACGRTGGRGGRRVRGARETVPKRGPSRCDGPGRAPRAGPRAGPQRGPGTRGGGPGPPARRSRARRRRRVRAVGAGHRCVGARRAELGRGPAAASGAARDRGDAGRARRRVPGHCSAGRGAQRPGQPRHGAREPARGTGRGPGDGAGSARGRALTLEPLPGSGVCVARRARRRVAGGRGRPSRRGAGWGRAVACRTARGRSPRRGAARSGGRVPPSPVPAGRPGRRHRARAGAAAHPDRAARVAARGLGGRRLRRRPGGRLRPGHRRPRSGGARGRRARRRPGRRLPAQARDRLGGPRRAQPPARGPRRRTGRGPPRAFHRRDRAGPLPRSRVRGPPDRHTGPCGGDRTGRADGGAAAGLAGPRARGPRPGPGGGGRRRGRHGGEQHLRRAAGVHTGRTDPVHRRHRAGGAGGDARERSGPAGGGAQDAPPRLPLHESRVPRRGGAPRGPGQRGCGQHLPAPEPGADGSPRRCGDRGPPHRPRRGRGPHGGGRSRRARGPAPRPTGQPPAPGARTDLRPGARTPPGSGPGPGADLATASGTRAGSGTRTGPGSVSPGPSARPGVPVRCPGRGLSGSRAPRGPPCWSTARSRWGRPRPTRRRGS